MGKFDPYRKWLGIPKEEQPPNHYRLLGIGLFESDRDVISNAADRQMAHLRTYQSGRYSKQSQDLLNEISAAQLCLLDEAKRAAYDAELRAKGISGSAIASRSAPSKPIPRPPGPPGSTPVPKAVAKPAPVRGVPIDESNVHIDEEADATTPEVGADYASTYASSSHSAGYSRRRKKQSPVPLILGGVAVALIGIGVLVAITASSGPQPAPAPAPPVAARPSGPATRPKPQPDRRKKPKKPNRPRPAPETSGPKPRTVRPGHIRELEGHEDVASTALFSPNPAFAISGGFDESLRLWDVEDGENMRCFDGIDAPILALDFSNDGERVLASMGTVDPPGGGSISILNASSGRLLDKVDLAGPKVAWDAKFSSDDSAVLVACEDGTVRLLDVANKSQLLNLQGHRGPVRTVAFSPGGDAIASGGADGTVRLWNRHNGTPGPVMTGHSGAVTGVAFSPAGDYVLSCGSDDVVRYWSAVTGRQVRACRGHTGAVHAVAHAPNAPFALSAGSDATVRYWDLTTGLEVCCFERHTAGVRSVAFSKDGTQAISAGGDRLVHLWQLPEATAGGEIAGGEIASGEIAQDPIEIPADARQAIPSTSEQRAALKEIQNGEFKEEFEQADRPSRRLALAERLLAEGAKQGSDPARSYALLRLAWKEATDHAEPDLALRAVDEMGKYFQVDIHAAKAATLDLLANKMEGSASARKRALTEQILTAMDEAATANNPTAVTRLGATATRVATKMRDADFTQTVTARVERAEKNPQAIPASPTAIAGTGIPGVAPGPAPVGDTTPDAPAPATSTPDTTENPEVQQALNMLKANPEDPAANLLAGKHVCFALGNWGQGLPMLAASSDRSLRPLARADLKEPAETAQRLDLADRWWEVGEGLEGPSKKHVQEHAAAYYSSILDQLAAVDQARAQVRILESGGDADATPDGIPKVDGFECREANVRKVLLDAYGGTEKSEEAVGKGLQWLADHQYLDGHWSFDHETPKFEGRAMNQGMAEGTNAATAMALLPFLAAGHTAREGDFRTTVSKGIKYLRTRMVSQGNVCIFYEPEAEPFPSHALATMALCEASGLGRDRQIQATAQSAIRFIVLSQNPDGGWGYHPQSANRVASVSTATDTMWNLAALKAAEWAKLPVPPQTLQRGGRFIRMLKVKEGDIAPVEEKKKGKEPVAPPTIGGYRNDLTAATSSDRAMTLALLSKLYLGESPKDPEIAKHAKDLAAQGPSTSGRVLQNFFDNQIMRDAGDTDWKTWNESLREYLLTLQMTGADEPGSWFFSSSPLSARGGRLYCTAIATLTLETYYRNPPPSE